MWSFISTQEVYEHMPSVAFAFFPVLSFLLLFLATAKQQKLVWSFHHLGVVAYFCFPFFLHIFFHDFSSHLHVEKKENGRTGAHIWMNSEEAMAGGRSVKGLSTQLACIKGRPDPISWCGGRGWARWVGHINLLFLHILLQTAFVTASVTVPPLCSRPLPPRANYTLCFQLGKPCILTLHRAWVWGLISNPMLFVEVSLRQTFNGQSSTHNARPSAGLLPNHELENSARVQEAPSSPQWFPVDPGAGQSTCTRLLEARGLTG